MKTKLAIRLHRAITCVNEYDSDTIFNEKLGEIRMYARLINKKHGEHCVLGEIIHIIDGALSKAKHSKKEKEQITKTLRSIQEIIK